MKGAHHLVLFLRYGASMVTRMRFADAPRHVRPFRKGCRYGTFQHVHYIIVTAHKHPLRMALIVALVSH